MKYGEIAWEDFDGPGEYRPSAVEPALALLRSADSQAAARAAYNELLFAVGNSHQGTFYPAALRAAEVVSELARGSSVPQWVRWAATEILKDWATSFVAQPGYEFLELPSGEQCGVEQELRSLSSWVLIDEDG